MRDEMVGLRLAFDDAVQRAKVLRDSHDEMLAAREVELAALQRAFEADQPGAPLRLVPDGEVVATWSPPDIADLAVTFIEDGTAYRFRPERDITAWELAMLWPRFTPGVRLVGSMVEWLAEHDLLRHFEVVK